MMAGTWVGGGESIWAGFHFLTRIWARVCILEQRDSWKSVSVGRMPGIWALSRSRFEMWGLIESVRAMYSPTFKTKVEENSATAKRECKLEKRNNIGRPLNSFYHYFNLAICF